MVNQNIVRYLLEGRRRGFSIDLLKQKLIDGGFREIDVNEAIGDLNKHLGIESPPKSEPLPEKKEVDYQKGFYKNRTSEDSVLEERMGIFSKIGKSITNPIGLFKNTSTEGTGGALNFWLVSSLFPIITISAIVFLLLKEVIDQTNKQLDKLTFEPPKLILDILGNEKEIVVLLFFILVVIILFYFALPIFQMLYSAILHLFAKMFGGVGTFADSYRAAVYSMGPALIFWFLLPISLIWSMILTVIGVSNNHEISKVKAFFVLFSYLLLAGIIAIAYNIVSKTLAG